jgi:hypothetical protein
MGFATFELPTVLFDAPSTTTAPTAHTTPGSLGTTQ